METDNKAFHAILESALERTDLNDVNEVQPVLFHAQHNYLENNWKENTDGQGYIPKSWTGRPDLQRRVQDAYTKLRPFIEAVEEDFAQRYGWTPNKTLGPEAKLTPSVSKR